MVNVYDTVRIAGTDTKGKVIEIYTGFGGKPLYVIETDNKEIVTLPEEAIISE